MCVVKENLKYNNPGLFRDHTPEDEIHPKRFSRKEVLSMPALSKGHWADLIFENKRFRVWRARGTKEDGFPFDLTVYVENTHMEVIDYKYNHQYWRLLATYEPKY